MFEQEKELVSELLTLCNETEKPECELYAKDLVAAEAAVAMKGNPVVAKLIEELENEADGIQRQVMDRCDLEKSTEVGIKVVIGKRRVILQAIDALKGPDMEKFSAKVKRAIEIVKDSREAEKN
jgi:hypothetical protein